MNNLVSKNSFLSFPISILVFVNPGSWINHFKLPDFLGLFIQGAVKRCSLTRFKTLSI